MCFLCNWLSSNHWGGGKGGELKDSSSLDAHKCSLDSPMLIIHQRGLSQTRCSLGTNPHRPVLGLDLLLID